MSKNEQKPAQHTAKPATPRRPNEQGSISVQAHMRIFDPKTQKTYVEGRAGLLQDWPKLQDMSRYMIPKAAKFFTMITMLFIMKI